MRQSLRWLGVAAVLVALSVTARADEEKIPVDKLPKAVVNAVKAKFEGAKLTGAEKETKDGKTTYEVTFTHKGKKLEAILTAEGKILAVEKAIAVADLPRAVTEGVAAKYPKAKIKGAEEITKGGKTLYEVVIETAGKKIEVVLDAKGKIIETEEKKGKEEKE
jgi:uncharacterized membrane protein YkoI